MRLLIRIGADNRRKERKDNQQDNYNQARYSQPVFGKPLHNLPKLRILFCNIIVLHELCASFPDTGS